MTVERRPVGQPVERVRGEHPTGDDWRADALASSRHSRLIDELVLPTDDFDRGRAIEVCSAIARNVLRDFAPALILLPAELRLRAQVLAAYTATLFDFSLQTGVEGERLAALNRWEFDLERAFEGSPVGQPVFVLLADENRRHAWDREAFDRLTAAARERIVATRPATSEDADRRASGLAIGLLRALAGRQLDDAARWAGAVIRVRHLTTAEEDVRRKRPQLPSDRLPLEWLEDEEARRRELAAAIAAEATELRRELESQGSVIRGLPRELRRAARYVDGAAASLLARSQRASTSALRLGPLPRVGHLLRAWLSR